MLDKIGRSSDLPRRVIDAVLDALRVHEVLAEARKVFEENGGHIEAADVIRMGGLLNLRVITDSE